MNIQGFDLMNALKENRYSNKRILASETGYSLGKVNSSIKELCEEGFLDKGLKLTEKAEHLFAEGKPKRAIILAEGRTTNRKNHKTASRSSDYRNKSSSWIYEGTI